jgi:predicted protein tyrosine phosphatase
MKHVLFVGDRREQRCQTAAQLFTGTPGTKVQYACIGSSARHPLSEDELDWAHLIFVMDERTRERLDTRFGETIHGKRVVNLGLPVELEHLDLRLVEMLRSRVRPHLSAR